MVTGRCLADARIILNLVGFCCQARQNGIDELGEQCSN